MKSHRIRHGRRGLGQRVSLAAAWVSYGAALICLGCLAWWLGPLGGDHPAIASLAAAVVFFVGAGVVLHVIGRTDLPNLRFDRKDGPPPGA
jgi:uncharacterized membrane protein YbhN (UPF0104 family)